MTQSHDKHMRDLVSKVDEVLLHQGDPIGVREYEQAWDEYSSYAPGLLRIAMRGHVDSVADQLERIKHIHMGLTHKDRALDMRIAQLIVDLASDVD